ncbi:hypothetical protein UFOVP567_45 [uncultured Caudovirales phage]|uniref:Uncharacterized protein n=1 Tax=uncultured Caudovirales phage TaxID=2100421 RepID=A0A6J5N3T7_9CAUD|nr:hypothetical protein UFOVP567_45 [uncultured Caudovirales phage]
MTTSEMTAFAATCTVNQMVEKFLALEAAGDQVTTDALVAILRPRFAKYNPGFIGKPERRRRAVAC